MCGDALKGQVTVHLALLSRRFFPLPCVSKKHQNMEHTEICQYCCTLILFASSEMMLCNCLAGNANLVNASLTQASLTKRLCLNAISQDNTGTYF